MTLHFIGDKASEIKIIKETKKYITFIAKGNQMKYRLNKETGEVQDGTYNSIIKGLYVTE